MNSFTICLIFALIATPIIFIGSRFYINEFENRLVADSKDYLRFFRVKCTDFSTANSPYHTFNSKGFIALFFFLVGFSYLAYQQWEVEQIKFYAFLLYLSLLSAIALIDYHTKWLTKESTFYLGIGGLALGVYAGFPLHYDAFFIVLTAVFLIQLFSLNFIGEGDLYLYIALALLFGGENVLIGGIFIAAILQTCFNLIQIVVFAISCHKSKTLKKRPFKHLLKIGKKRVQISAFGQWIIIGTLLSFFYQLELTDIFPPLF